MKVWLVLLLVPFCSTADSRLSSLRSFLKDRPAEAYAAAFLAASDHHALDWRLLPALAVIETSGGRHVRSRNNWFGWDSGRARFESVEAGIETVAWHLTKGRRYRGKSLLQKLQVYNPRPGYAERVRRIMRLIR